MRIIRIIYMTFWVAGLPLLGLCSEPSTVTPAPEAKALAEASKHEEHGLTPDAPRVGRTGTAFVTSSMVVTWVVGLGLIVFARYATRKVQLIPSGAQNFVEWLVETLYEFLEGIIGAKLVKRTFWFFATVFIFILFTNWFGLMPGVGTIGWGVPASMDSRSPGPCSGAATPT